MRRKSALARLLALPVGALLCAASALSAHRPDTYQIAPDKTTMLVGEMRVFRMVDQNGRTQRNVTWSISNTEAFQSLQGDQLQLIA
jgi:hypothetical protein